jgi:hypothetical protein
MRRRFYSGQWCVVSNWRKAVVVALLTCACAKAAFADGTGSLDSFVGPLKNGLNLTMVFGFVAGCAMVMSDFFNAKRDVFILTMLLNGDNGMPLLAKFLLALLPTALPIAYIMGLRSRNRLDSIWICLLPGSMALPFSRSVSNHVIP